MGYPLKKSSSSSSKKSIRPGDYDAVVLKLADAAGYVPGDAFTVTYELSRDGKIWTFKETFVNDLEEPRTAAFVKYLTDNGIDAGNIDAFVGCHEKVKLLKQAIPGRGTFLNIVERQFA